MRRFAGLLLILTLSGCSWFSSQTSAQTLAASGEFINATGTLFVDTAKLITPPCNAKTLPRWEVVCPAFKAFEQKFKKAWPMATGLWYAAKEANDPKLQKPAMDAVKMLRGELDTFAAGGK